MVAKVLSQGYTLFAVLGPNPGSLSRTDPPGLEARHEAGHR